MFLFLNCSCEGRGEEIPLVQGKEQQLRFAGTAVKRYATFKVRWWVLQEGTGGRHNETIITEN